MHKDRSNQRCLKVNAKIKIFFLKKRKTVGNQPVFRLFVRTKIITDIMKHFIFHWPNYKNQICIKTGRK